MTATGVKQLVLPLRPLYVGSGDPLRARLGFDQLVPATIRQPNASRFGAPSHPDRSMTSAEPPKPPREPSGSDVPISRLRGPAVEFDTRRISRVVTGICLVGLAVLVVALFAGAAHRNAEISLLQDHGVPVAVTVTGCRGELSGSGSNAAGYTCTGAFTLQGHRYDEPIGGLTSFKASGQAIRAVTDPDDPRLLSTAVAVSRAHASSSAFAAPILLLVFLVLAAALVLWRVRGKPSTDGRGLKS